MRLNKRNTPADLCRGITQPVKEVPVFISAVLQIVRTA